MTGVQTCALPISEEKRKQLLAEKTEDQKEESKKICIELIEAFRSVQGVKGVHLMGHKKEEVISEIIKKSKK